AARPPTARRPRTGPRRARSWTPSSRTWARRSSPMRRDYYAVLGIAATAPPREIRQAYRRLARQYSPDVNFWDAAARGLFEEIDSAYRVLSDPDARAHYDRVGLTAGRADAV